MSILGHLVHCWRLIFASSPPYPLGSIIEGASSLQCCCPVCDYYDPKAWKESFLDGGSQIEVVRCGGCGTEFLGLSMGGKGRPASNAEIAAARAISKELKV